MLVIDKHFTFSKSSGTCSFLSCTMAAMSFATRVMSLDRDLSLPRSLVSKYSSQESTRICLKDSRTQRAYGAMVMGGRQVKVNKVLSPTVGNLTHGSWQRFSHSTIYNPQSTRFFEILKRWSMPSILLVYSDIVGI